MTYLVGSVCSGTLALEAGVAMALGDHELAWVADNDPGCARILAGRAPGIPNLGDVTSISWEETGPVDIMCAGFPCQPVSGAGQQKGMADERWIWPHIAAGIGRMVTPPRMLVLENVPRLLTIDGGAALAQVICSLAALGYVGRYGIYRASDTGACHERKRWFCVAAHTQHGSVAQWARRPGWQGGQWAPVGFRPESRAETFAWGEYRPAIKRWEAITGYPAPSPAEPGEIMPGLSPRFREWMMGLPPGWVTGVPGLGLSQKVSAIGNSVIPHQAAMAVTALSREMG